jgi:hypothetical protein
MLRFIIHQFRLAKFFASLKETSGNGTKNLGKARKSDAEGVGLNSG